MALCSLYQHYTPVLLWFTINNMYPLPSLNRNNLSLLMQLFIKIKHTAPSTMHMHPLINSIQFQDVFDNRHVHTYFFDISSEQHI